LISSLPLPPAIRQQGFNISGICTALALTLVSVLSFAGSASAASQTVQGTGDIDKMVVRNATSALKVKLYGFKPPCEAHYMKATLDWGTKAGYEIINGCYPGATWAKSLVYLPDRSKPEGGKLLRCPKFRFSHSAADGSYRAYVPRSCIPKAGNRVKVRSSGDNYGSMTGGTAGPTRSLRRG
jgi:hypothetical protein